MTALALAVSALAWVGCGALAWTGTARGPARASRSLAQLVGAYHLSPDPVGPPVTGYTGAVIGDSRAARLGGPPVPATGPSARPDDAVCKRSTDSLAAEIGDLLPARVLNLACPDATVTAGLRGPQDIGGQQVPAQVGVLRQVQGLRFVVRRDRARTTSGGPTSCATATACPTAPTRSPRTSSTTGSPRSTAPTATCSSTSTTCPAARR